MWREQLEIGKEVTYGTAVAGTRKVYASDVSLTRERDPRPYAFQTGGRDNVRGFTLGPVRAGGSISFPMSADEIVEWLLMGLKGGVTPTTPPTATNTRLWAFTPGVTLDSATIRRDDGAGTPRITSGIYVDEITIAGSVGGDNKVTCTLFASNKVAGALTGGLTDRTPTYLDGWQTKFYLDAFGATPGTTVVAGSLLNWNVRIRNQMGRIYTASNTLAASGVTSGVLDITAQVTLLASQAQAQTEFTNWDAATKRLMRLEFQDETSFIETTFRRFVTIDVPMAWSAFDLNQSEAGARAYALSGQYVYDPTNSFGVQVRAQNNRNAAWA